MVQILYNYAQFLSNYSETTKETYLINANLFLKYCKEQKINYKRIKKIDIYRYIDYMKDLAKSTIKCRLNSVKNFYSFLNRDLSLLLFKNIKIYGINKKTPRFLSSFQIERLLSYYKDKRNSLIIFLFLNTGIRISELANIRIENIHIQEKYIEIKVKGGYYRNVYINEIIKEKIIVYVGDKKSGLLFNLKRRQIHNIVTGAIKDLGYLGSAHTLRHTFATQIYKKTKDILLVKELLGHTSIASTQIYTHLDNESVMKTLENNPLNLSKPFVSTITK